jgi:acyl-CoA thioesterase FadM
MWPGDGGFSAWTNDEDSTSWVSAANTIETIDRIVLLSSTPSFYMHDVEVGIEGSLAHVGNTSFRGEYRLYRLKEDGSAGALFATVASTGVYVEKESLRPVPLPRREELLQHCAPRSQRFTASPQPSQRPTDAYVWATAVRETECDNLGHLNNTRYAMYAEDALGAAVYHGAFSDELDVLVLAQQPPCSMHISYIHEVKPYAPLYCAVWYDPVWHTFVIEMRTGEGGAVADGGTLASVVVLGVAATGTPTASPRL